MHSYEKLAQILRIDKDNILAIEKKFGALTGREDAMFKIVEENQTIIDSRLALLNASRDFSAKEIYGALINKVEVDNSAIHKFLGEPRATSSADWERVLETTKNIIKPPKGFFLKKEKAMEFLKNKPPLNVIRALGYRNVDELINNENFFEIFSSLRFVEGAEWLNKEFLPQYESITRNDFEEREVTVIALSEKWAGLAQGFIRKKHHNISHLKELGMIYVIPIALNISGETLRNFSLILHYFNEVAFYSKLFKRFANDQETFSKNLMSLLRGDVVEKRIDAPESGKSRWMIIQRYLSKDDENDWRLFEPHINPEALHWEKAERMLLLISRELKGFSSDLSFWHDLNWVGDYFKTDSGIDVLVSFNLVDASMDLVKQKDMTKYLYHHQESLWNRIFIEYFGEEKMEEIMIENIIKGYVDL